MNRIPLQSVGAVILNSETQASIPYVKSYSYRILVRMRVDLERAAAAQDDAEVRQEAKDKAVCAPLLLNSKVDIRSVSYKSVHLGKTSVHYGVTDVFHTVRVSV